jgi:hypothetical protein
MIPCGEKKTRHGWWRAHNNQTRIAVVAKALDFFFCYTFIPE